MDQQLADAFEKSFRKSEYLTPERELELVAALKGGDQKQADRAKETLVSAHMRMTTRYINKASRQIKRATLAREDLVQEAAIGLCMAAEKFDPSYGVRFSTYAMFWVKMYVENYLHQNNHVVKLAVTKDSRKAIHFYLYLERKLKLAHKNISDEEVDRIIADKLSVPLHMLTSMKPFLKFEPYELDKPMLDSRDPESTSTLMDYLVDDSPSAEDVVLTALEVENQMKPINKVVDRLSHREQTIFRERIISESEDKASLQTLADKFGISKERIRQIESAVIKKLRDNIAGVSKDFRPQRKRRIDAHAKEYP